MRSQSIVHGYVDSRWLRLSQHRVRQSNEHDEQGPYSHDDLGEESIDRRLLPALEHTDDSWVAENLLRRGSANGVSHVRDEMR